MFSQAIRYLVPVGVGAAVFIPTTVYAKSESDCKKKKFTAADVYDEPATGTTKVEDCRVTELEKCVKMCREGLGPVKGDLDKYTSSAKSIFNEYSAVVKENVDYLQKKAPVEAKYATIAGSAMLGFLLGIRKGLVRKLFYAALAGGGAFSVIYPKEAKVYSKEGCAMAKKYGTIVYNFIVLGPGAEDPKKLCPVRKNANEKREKEKQCPTPAEVKS